MESGSEVVLLDNIPNDLGGHNGGAMHFGRDGKLYVATGDHGGRSRAQLLTNQFGKVLRLNPDGTIPTDNPLVGLTAVTAPAPLGAGPRV